MGDSRNFTSPNFSGIKSQKNSEDMKRNRNEWEGEHSTLENWIFIAGTVGRHGSFGR